MINQVLSVTPTKTGQVLFPSTVTVPGTPMLVGSIPAINLDAYQATIGGATCYFDGCYSLTVAAYRTSSPLTGKTINIGDPIYATGGSLDATTNVTTGFTLDADSGDNSVLFGYLDSSNSGPLLSGTTAVVNVRLADKV
jgi:hypothetical protein